MEICYVPPFFSITKLAPLFFYLILFAIPFGFSAAQLTNRTYPYLTNASEQRALLGFLSAATNYTPSPSLRATWKPNVSCCQWTGVICSKRTQRVVTLNVRSMGLEGTISPLLANLSFLRILDLRNNSFYGHIPYQLGTLFRLKMLLLSWNQLEGSIPPTLGGCRSLQNLSMSFNHLRGNIPSQLCVLRKLQYIHLGSNNLTGTIPACLGNISSLDYVNLNTNNLHGRIPSEIGLLSLVGDINMWNNHLTGPIPSSLLNCTSLRQLTIANNQLTGHITAELCSKNTRLTGLYLFGNQLRGNIPPSLFNCTKLQVIEFGRNQLSGKVPMELGKLTQLQHLYLNNNQLVSNSVTSLPFLNALTNCSSLQTIALSFNRLRGRLPFSIGHLSTKMNIIYLGNNELAGEIPPHIGNLTSITLLDLDSNSFTGSIPSSLNRLQKLERLYLGFNNLQGSIPMEIGQIKTLGLLDLAKNNLSGKIPNSLERLQQLRYLNLNQNQLFGNIPASLGNCVNLLQLDLSYNRLNGRIPPKVAGLANLVLYFNLSNNLLQGPLPFDLSKMTMVQAIDISENQLTGEIPSSFGSCQVLNYLNLSCNALEGSIPVSLGELQNLQDMDLSSNNLSGEIPVSLGNLKFLSHLNFSFNKLSGQVPQGGVFKYLGAAAFTGNFGLCGSWVHLPPCSNSKHKIHLHLKRVIILVAATAVVMWCLFFGIMWRQNGNRNIMRDTQGSVNVGSQKISYRELVIATHEFSDANLLGVGSFANVYKGVLKDGTIVAVKLLNLEIEGADESFDRECNVLETVRHRNLIRLITFYSHRHFKALIFPLMPNGSLENWLYPNEDEEKSLSLIQWLNIAIDIAQGMAYLHHHCFAQVIHCDLKPSNVLLGEDMTAYLIDFGIATMRLANVEDSTFISRYAFKGTTGYIPPEYGLGGHVTTKGDVYSYGILLLEMMTKRRPNHNMFVEGLNLQNWVNIDFPNQVEGVVDKSLLRRTSSKKIGEENKELHCITQILSVGLFCTKKYPHERPNMIEILHRLQSVKSIFFSNVDTS